MGSLRTPVAVILDQNQRAGGEILRPLADDRYESPVHRCGALVGESEDDHAGPVQNAEGQVDDLAIGGALQTDVAHMSCVVTLGPDPLSMRPTLKGSRLRE